jgi:hypothetical protein
MREMRKDGVGRLPSDKVMSTCEFIAHTVEEAAITPPDDPHVVASHFNVCSEGHNTTISTLLPSSSTMYGLALWLPLGACEEGGRERGVTMTQCFLTLVNPRSFIQIICSQIYI